ncbi:MAG: hypothetical protein KAJ18_05155 [Candidatus Omnitrophica bacterium]|nr:hypothetical protein [Candidatus Omnitrophota bacterium]
MKIYTNNQRSLLLAFFLSFVAWVFCFRAFISGNAGLFEDAVPYYDHIKFFIDNIVRGTYPLWDSYWNAGVPNEFFLRRMGSFNPLFILVLIFHKVGIPYMLSYLMFMVFYFFLGMFGFFLLARHLFKDDRLAFTAYLILMFSSIGTRIFDSYFMLVITPLVWFFYFLFAFAEKQKKLFLLGIVLAFMILMTTYVPFYFIAIFLAFLMFFVPCYFSSFKKFLVNFWRFSYKNKIFIAFCVFAIMISFLPGVLFFLEGKGGELAMPRRHHISTDQNILGVSNYTITRWAIPEDILYSYTFDDFRRFCFALLYVPVFGFILFFLGAFSAITRRTVFLLLWGGFVFLVGSPRLTPLYDFLYNHVFFFRYFRNLHFFLWFLLLPISVLLVVGQAGNFLRDVPQTKAKKVFLSVLVLLVHLGVFIFVFNQGTAIMSTYLALGLSLMFFVLCALGVLKERNTVFLLFLLGAVVVQPVQVYGYLAKNSRSSGVKDFEYDKVSLDFSFTRQRGYSRGAGLYFATHWYNFLAENLPGDALDRYLQYKFVVYDNVEWMPDQDFNISRVQRIFAENQNIALVSPHPSDEASEDFIRKGAGQALLIEGDSDQFQLLRYNTNDLTIRTRFDSPKFLVYTDTFHKDWHAYLNGKETDLFRANVAFKGLWLPAGENIIRLKFGNNIRHLLNFAFMALFYGVFLVIIFLWRKDLRSSRSMALK